MSEGLGVVERYDARFPHLKHPFLEMLYAIYKRKYRNETIYNYSLFSFFFDFVDDSSVPFEI